MRKITKKTCEAFYNKKPCKISNSEVYIAGPDTVQYYLHGNMIAQLKGNVLLVENCGRQSNTTKERLNGVLSQFGLGGIFQKNWTWYYEQNGKVEKFDRWMTFELK